MTNYTIQVENPDEESVLDSFLNKMKISFSKDKQFEENFIFTDEMKRVIDERLKEDKSKSVNAWDALKEIRAKYEI